MNLQKTSKLLTPLLGAVILSASSAAAAVSALTFSSGAGTTSFDQYTGTAGGGWLTPWSVANGSNTTNISSKTSVLGATPLYSGGGNYLHVGYDAGAAASSAGASRQWDINSISMTDSFVVDFYFRSDTAVSNANQVFNLFGSSAAAVGTGSTNSWAINFTGGGITATNYDSAGTALAAATLLTQAQSQQSTPGVAFHFTLTINPVADTYTVAVTNLNNSVSVTSAVLGLRNKNDTSLSYLNFGVARAASALAATDLGYSIDNISITSLAAVPEPGTYSLLAGGACLAVGYLRSSRRRRA